MMDMEKYISERSSTFRANALHELPLKWSIALTTDAALQISVTLA
jgi:hypothetical protein